MVVEDLSAAGPIY